MGLTGHGCGCYTLITPDEGCTIYVCAECTALGISELMSRPEEREDQLTLGEIASAATRYVPGPSSQFRSRADARDPRSAPDEGPRRR